MLVVNYMSPVINDYCNLSCPVLTPFAPTPPDWLCPSEMNQLITSGMAISALTPTIEKFAKKVDDLYTKILGQYEQLAGRKGLSKAEFENLEDYSEQTLNRTFEARPLLIKWYDFTSIYQEALNRLMGCLGRGEDETYQNRLARTLTQTLQPIQQSSKQDRLTYTINEMSRVQFCSSRQNSNNLADIVTSELALNDMTLINMKEYFNHEQVMKARMDIVTFITMSTMVGCAIYMYRMARSLGP